MEITTLTIVEGIWGHGCVKQPYWICFIIIISFNFIDLTLNWPWLNFVINNVFSYFKHHCVCQAEPLTRLHYSRGQQPTGVGTWRHTIVNIDNQDRLPCGGFGCFLKGNRFCVRNERVKYSTYLEFRQFYKFTFYLLC